MRWEKRQAKVEESVYECIDDIAEELDLEVPYYPEVYWVGRKLRFKELHLPPEHKDAFYEAKDGGSRLINLGSGRHVILIGKANTAHTSEEGAHSLHLSVSKINNKRKDPLDGLGVRLMIETFGFFGSKLIVPGRRSSYSDYRDLMPKNSWDKQGIADTLDEVIRSKDMDYPDFFIAQQGWGLGQRLFEYYISGEISKKQVLNLFLDDFKDPYSAICKFLELKYHTLK